MNKTKSSFDVDYSWLSNCIIMSHFLVDACCFIRCNPVFQLAVRSFGNWKFFHISIWKLSHHTKRGRWIGNANIEHPVSEILWITGTKLSVINYVSENTQLAKFCWYSSCVRSASEMSAQFFFCSSSGLLLSTTQSVNVSVDSHDQFVTWRVMWSTSAFWRFH